MAKDICIMCGVETPYEFETHIDYRYGYIEGAGQLCKTCYERDTKHEQIVISSDLIYNTPNDQELGTKVRQLYFNNLKT